MQHKFSSLAMAFVCSPYHWGLNRVLTWLGIGDKHHKIRRTKVAVVDSSWQQNIFAQILGMACPIKLPSQCKTCFPEVRKTLLYRGGGGGGDV